VLLLDEPFGAPDAKVRTEPRDWVRRLRDEVHVTRVFVSHDHDEALDLADSIVVINHGRIEQIGTLDELSDQPANGLVMGFLGPVTRLGGRPVRPHDMIVERSPAPGSVPARTRLVRVGFEVCVELAVGEGDEVVTAVVTRAEAPRPHRGRHRVRGRGPAGDDACFFSILRGRTCGGYADLPASSAHRGPSRWKERSGACSPSD
jgi:sulfate/thiosulfate transport system ATP-binding protein